MGLILYGIEGGALVERVENFKCLGRPLYQSDDDWTAKRWNIKRLQKLWGRLGKLLRR